MPSEMIWMLVTLAGFGGIIVLSGLAFGPRNALVGTRALFQQLDKLYFALGYVCGVELLLLGFFITYQVVARKLDWVQAPGTDVMSGYVLAMAATWAFSYSLRSGAHVRIDVLLPYMGTKTRAVADWLAMAAVLFLGWVTMWKMWENVINNYERGVVTNDYPLTPLFIPKIVVSLGFTLLCLTALQLMYAMVAEALLARWNAWRGGEAIETIAITEGEAAGVAD
jgi:TRAP-type mannitol/chloroaromatic compound transport system permease small subunit